jgi:hypothetical protein
MTTAARGKVLNSHMMLYLMLLCPCVAQSSWHHMRHTAIGGVRPRAHEAINAVSWQAGQVRAERHTLLHRSRRIGTCANQRAESAIRPLCHAAFSCESMEAEHKKVRESVHIDMHDRAHIVCSSRPAHACKAAEYLIKSGAHSNPTQADGPSEPAPPTP